jgi:hypothetical protein
MRNTAFLTRGIRKGCVSPGAYTLHAEAVTALESAC